MRRLNDVMEGEILGAIPKPHDHLGYFPLHPIVDLIRSPFYLYSHWLDNMIKLAIKYMENSSIDPQTQISLHELEE